MEPFEAAIKGAREVAFTIMSISLSLVAVFIPIFFMPGVIGGLFREFAIVVSLAILVSAIVSLTLVPMLAAASSSTSARTTRCCAGRPGSSAATSGRCARYERSLDWCLAHRPVVLGVAIAQPRGDHRPLHLHPEGLLPHRGHRPDHRARRGGRGHLVPRDERDVITQGERRAARQPRGGERHRLGRRHQHRAHLRQPQAASGEREGIEKVIEELRRDVRGIPGRGGVLHPAAEPAHRRAHQQGALPVRAEERGRPRACRRAPTRWWR